MRTRPSKNYTNADLAIATVLGFLVGLLTMIVASVAVMALGALIPSIRGPQSWLFAAIEFGACLVGGTAGAGIAQGRAKARRRRFFDQRTQALSTLRCPRCDYDLRGTPLPRCPECGESFTPKEWALTKPGRIE